ncbi:MAG: hypothetical protein GY722_18795 [bacterium]|nr:hypothetical protein [bacterium]
MAKPQNPVADLTRRQSELKQQLAEIGPMCPGSLTERYRKCGKPSCHCARPGPQGHGPSWSLTRTVRGKTVTKIIPTAALERTQAQVAEYQRFRALSRELVEISAQLCGAQLKPPAKTALGEVKKRGSKPI